MAPPPSPDPDHDIYATIRRASARASERRDSSIQQNEFFPMSPGPGDNSAFVETPARGETRDYFNFASSPEPVPPPTVPRTRRSSAVDSSFNEYAALTTFPSSTSEVSGVTGVSESVFSERSAAPFAEADRRLQEYVRTTEPDRFEKIPAANIPTEIPDELKTQAYTFDCAFGWTGDQDSDLDDAPKTKKGFLGKLDKAKEGTDFIFNALNYYQTEINSRRHHKFLGGFLAHQNTAIIITNEQLDQINEELDKVIAEVECVKDDDAHIDDKLVEAYKHAAPWVKRTKRVLFDAHVFYKLNYSVVANNKSVGKRSAPVNIPGSARPGR